MKPLPAAALLLAVSCTAALLAVGAHHDHRGDGLEALERTLLLAPAAAPVAVPRLVSSDSRALTAERLRGKWTVLFFGFTACPEVCPTTLQALAAMARDPASGVAAGRTQIVFVSVDPERDTPERVREYLAQFDARIVGFTGSKDAVERFQGAVGAGAAPSAAGIDHSTSAFVLSPEGRLAGVLLRPSAPARMVIDLTRLREAHARTLVSGAS
jgi:protein SCO1/2